MSIIVGLTGPTGAGKSRAAETARKMGIKVIDCDLVARKAVLPESEGLKALCKVFGTEILESDGTLNRKKLARIAFSEKEKTELLNRTLFPFIKELINKELNGEKILLDAPTLFESGLDSVCNTTVAVLADDAVRLSRIISRDNLSQADAEIRMSAGKSNAFYVDRAEHIIYNNDGPNIFEFEVAGLFKIIYGGKK